MSLRFFGGKGTEPDPTRPRPELRVSRGFPLISPLHHRWTRSSCSRARRMRDPVVRVRSSLSAASMRVTCLDGSLDRLGDDSRNGGVLPAFGGRTLHRDGVVIQGGNGARHPDRARSVRDVRTGPLGAALVAAQPRRVVLRDPRRCGAGVGHRRAYSGAPAKTLSPTDGHGAFEVVAGPSESVAMSSPRTPSPTRVPVAAGRGAAGSPPDRAAVTAQLWSRRNRNIPYPASESTHRARRVKPWTPTSSANPRSSNFTE